MDGVQGAASGDAPALALVVVEAAETRNRRGHPRGDTQREDAGNNPRQPCGQRCIGRAPVEQRPGPAQRREQSGAGKPGNILARPRGHGGHGQSYGADRQQGSRARIRRGPGSRRHRHGGACSRQRHPGRQGTQPHDGDAEQDKGRREEDPGQWGGAAAWSGALQQDGGGAAAGQ